jgi:citrate lyase beta subunit
MNAQKRIRRCELVCPATSLKMMTKAAASQSDEVIFDLEDASAASKKDDARRLLIEAFLTLSMPMQMLSAYRINGVETPHCYRDIVDVLEAVGARAQVLVVPKVRRAEEIHFVDCLLAQIEKRLGLELNTFRLEVLLETASGLENCSDIVSASPRIDSLIFGIADFAADMGMKDFRHNAGAFLFARQRMLLAARSAGVDAIDAVTVQFQDAGQCEADAQSAVALGFDGKWAIHPSQVDIIQRAFTPSADEIASAKRLMDAYADANARGLGAVTIDGEMVDAATLAVAARQLEIARRSES